MHGKQLVPEQMTSWLLWSKLTTNQRCGFGAPPDLTPKACTAVQGQCRPLQPWQATEQGGGFVVTTE